MVQISTRDADRILLAMFGVAEHRKGTFLERLKLMRHLGVPSGVPKGRGIRTGRSFEQMVELALAIHLLNVGLSSTQVAHLMRTEWPLASAALSVFTWGSVHDESGASIGTGEVFWVAEPQGWSEYRQDADVSLPRLVTFVLFEGERLQDKIGEWTERRGWATVVIPAREVIQELIEIYSELGIAGEGELEAALKNGR